MTQHPKPQTTPLSTRTLLLGIWGHLSRRRRIQLGALLLVILASGVAEVFSLAAVLPFLAVLTNPQRLWQVPVVQGLAGAVGIQGASGLLLPATVLFGTAAVLAAAVRLTNLWLNGRLAAAIGSDMSCEAYRRTLHQPYSVHVQRNSSGVITATTTHVIQTVGVLNTILQLTTASVVALGLLAALLVADWHVAFTAAAVFGSAYGLLVVTTRRRLAANSAVMAQASQQQLKALQEGLGAIRDVLLDGSQAAYLEIYRQADRPLRLKQAQSSFLSAFPRYGLEALGLLLIAVLALLLSWQRDSSATVIPLLGTLALGAQRLLPALQQVYSSWAVIRANRAAVAKVLDMLDQPIPETALKGSQGPLRLKEALRLQQLSFRYSDEGPWVLNGIDLEIQRGERVGIIGSTGSGKSTLLDLLMGLLEPMAGQILVDGQDLHDPEQPERLMAWRSTIAHVPQSIYLADSSIAENIAFGLPRDQIDRARVREAAEQAQIAGFIESSPEGYDSFVGEQGIRMSGGQRQRIGIARALYKQAQVLVFDEATSALDNETEAAVMEAIEGLSRDLTVIMIAHRLSTLSRCDRVIELANGMVERIVQPAHLDHVAPA
jgi:ABC-type multidrug transport system fused ATPase/permease subunit